ncbi:MAG TPA: hypothetical protein VI979_01615 [archaeon]|nr:hypothetical protein [archaeon]
MPELISLKNVPRNVKIELLKRLGYDSDGVFVLKDGERHLDRYIKEPVRIDNMLILPGSAIIIDNNPLSISSYLEEFEDAI